MLKTLMLLGGIAMAACCGIGSAEAQTTRETVVQRAVEDVIRPGYDGLAKATGAEARILSDLCNAPSADRLSAARAGFGDLVRSFEAVEVIRFGPMTEDNRFERFLFWPDRRGTALRQAQAIVGQRDTEATSPEGLRRKSVAVQGLLALEYVLFGGGADELAGPGTADFRCRYGATIASGLSTIADTVAEEWRDPVGISGRMTAPRADDPAYRTIDDSLGEIFAASAHNLEALRDLRIAAALGDGPGDTKPNLLLFTRSKLATEALVADIDGTRRLVIDSGLLELLPQNLQPLARRFDSELMALAQSIASLEPDLASAIQSPDGYATMEKAVAQVRGAEHLLTREVAPTLNLSAGFSSLDGD